MEGKERGGRGAVQRISWGCSTQDRDTTALKWRARVTDASSDWGRRLRENVKGKKFTKFTTIQNT